MSERNDGGPAFPNEGFNGWGGPQSGMTLRDYFAAGAMPVVAAVMTYAINNPEKSSSGDVTIDETTVARWAYSYADAMLAERAKC